MVCGRCVAAVKVELEKYGLHANAIKLGEAEVAETLSDDQLRSVETGLRALGFELIDDRKSRIIEKIKTVIIDLVHHSNEEQREKYSVLIAKALNYEYTYLSKLFSDVEGITIEQYTILQKVEKIKELIVYDELTLTEIADRMGYRSVAHLSSQFKKLTGLPPSHFKNLGPQTRKSLDNVTSA